MPNEIKKIESFQDQPTAGLRLNWLAAFAVRRTEWHDVPLRHRKKVALPVCAGVDAGCRRIFFSARLAEFFSAHVASGTGAAAEQGYCRGADA
jgi:hypothetical protein